jgi:2-haloacid dehalogenase
MLRDVVQHAGLAEIFDAVLSVDVLRIFKPHPSVYGLARRQLNLKSEEIGFVSSNFWDIAGAASYGFRTFWINRSNARAEKLGFHPYAVISDLSQISPFLG